MWLLLMRLWGLLFCIDEEEEEEQILKDGLSFSSRIINMWRQDWMGEGGLLCMCVLTGGGVEV